MRRPLAEDFPVVYTKSCIALFLVVLVVDLLTKERAIEGLVASAVVLENCLFVAVVATGVHIQFLRNCVIVQVKFLILI